MLRSAEHDNNKALSMTRVILRARPEAVKRFTQAFLTARFSLRLSRPMRRSAGSQAFKSVSMRRRPVFIGAHTLPGGFPTIMAIRALLIVALAFWVVVSAAAQEEQPTTDPSTGLSQDQTAPESGGGAAGDQTASDSSAAYQAALDQCMAQAQPSTFVPPAPGPRNGGRRDLPPPQLNGPTSPPPDPAVQAQSLDDAQTPDDANATDTVDWSDPGASGDAATGADRSDATVTPSASEPAGAEATADQSDVVQATQAPAADDASTDAAPDGLDQGTPPDASAGEGQSTELDPVSTALADCKAQTGQLAPQSAQATLAPAVLTALVLDQPANAPTPTPTPIVGQAVPPASVPESTSGDTGGADSAQQSEAVPIAPSPTRPFDAPGALFHRSPAPSATALTATPTSETAAYVSSGGSSGSYYSASPTAAPTSSSASSAGGTYTSSGATSGGGAVGSVPTDPSTGPVSGAWSGTTSQGKAISFTIDNNTVKSMTFGYMTTGCGGVDAQSSNSFQNGAPPITGGSLTLMADSGGTGIILVTGNFSSSTSVSGNIDVNIFGSLQPGTTTACQSSASITWSATASGH